MIRRPPRSTQTDTLFPYTTLFRSDGRPLSNTVGTVLDPIFSLRYHLMIPPGKVARVAFWTVVAPSQAELLDLVDKHHDRNAFDRAKTLAWTQAQVQLRHPGIEAEEAADFHRWAAPIIERKSGAKGKSVSGRVELWGHS